MEDRKEITPEVRESRRSLIKKVAYVVPVVLTLAASASFARAGVRPTPPARSTRLSTRTAVPR